MTPVMLEPRAPWSQVKHSTTEPLHSPSCFKKDAHKLHTVMHYLPAKKAKTNSADPDQTASGEAV